MTTKLVIDERFKVGDRVEALDFNGWRPAILAQHAPYTRTGSDGYYVTWADQPVPRPSFLSAGGWKPVSSLRPAVRPAANPRPCYRCGALPGQCSCAEDMGRS